MFLYEKLSKIVAIQIKLIFYRFSKTKPIVLKITLAAHLASFHASESKFKRRISPVSTQSKFSVPLSRSWYSFFHCSIYLICFIVSFGKILRFPYLFPKGPIRRQLPTLTIFFGAYFYTRGDCEVQLLQSTIARNNFRS